MKFIKCFTPAAVFEIFTPGIVECSLFVCSQDGRSQAAVTSCQNTFEYGDICFMPVVLDALAIQLVFDFLIYNLGFSEKFSPGCSLESTGTGKWFWNKERSADRDLALAVSLVFRDFIIASCNLICQMCDIFHIVLGFRWQSKHKIKFYFIPAGRQMPFRHHPESLLLSVLC